MAKRASKKAANPLKDDAQVQTAPQFTQITDYRPCLVNRRYQAQFKCPDCEAWIITENLEAWRQTEEPFGMVVEAVNVICKSQIIPLCGCEVGTVRFTGWRHSSPITWRRTHTVNQDAG